MDSCTTVWRDNVCVSVLYCSPGSGFPQFVSPETYEAGGGISPLTPPFLLPSHPGELMEVPAKYISAMALTAVDHRVGHVTGHVMLQ